MNMDIYSSNRLASMEHEQREHSMPVIPDYEAQNVEIQPGWALELAQRFVSGLGHLFRLLDMRSKPVSETARSADDDRIVGVLNSGSFIHFGEAHENEYHERMRAASQATTEPCGD